MHYIKNIFENNIDLRTHNKFIRYSRGVFTGPLIKLKVVGSNLKVSSSFHLTDELLLIISDILGNTIVHVKGSLIWNRDLTEEFGKLGIKYAKVTKSRGIFNYALDNEVNIKEFCNYMSDFNLLVSLKYEGFSLTTKSSFPKPNKEITPDFCKAVFPLKEAGKIFKELAFDVDFNKGVKEVVISHEIIIDELDLPNIENFEEARRVGKRKGILKRHVSVNGGEPKTTELKLCV